MFWVDGDDEDDNWLNRALVPSFTRTTSNASPEVNPNGFTAG